MKAPFTPILRGHFINWMNSCFDTNWRDSMPTREQTERELAFFSGFASYYFFSMEMTNLSDEDAETRLRSINEEIKAYFDYMGKKDGHPEPNPNQ